MHISFALNEREYFEMTNGRVHILRLRYIISGSYFSILGYLLFYFKKTVIGVTFLDSHF